jgi:hypothetical protein
MPFLTLLLTGLRLCVRKVKHEDSNLLIRLVTNIHRMMDTLSRLLPVYLSRRNLDALVLASVTVFNREHVTTQHHGRVSSGFPTSIARSSSRFPSSHEVSEMRRHPWHAARLALSVPCPVVSIQIGSDEHHCAFCNAATKVRNSRSGSPWRTRPPIVPSESPDAV